VGLIGQNGSGKSTCLKLLARILEPSSGTVSVQGRVSALLELGAGFHPELTGRENVFLYGAVLGVPRRELVARFDEIVDFAELERYIDMPVKFYSSGMYVRLGFATAISVEPDVLLVDEVLAVGDQSFQAKCLDRVRSLQAQGVTILFVSHDLDTVEALCDRALWFDGGRLAADGPSHDSISRYLQTLHERGLLSEPAVEASESLPAATETPVVEAAPAPDPAPDPVPDPTPDPAPTVSATPSLAPQRRGSLVARIVSARFLDPQGLPTCSLQTRGTYTLELCYQADTRIDQPVFGYAVHTASGLHVTGTNTALCGAPIASLLGTGRVTFAIPDLNLGVGDYLLSVALHSADEVEAYDYQDYAYPFTVTGDRLLAGGEGLTFIPGVWRHEPDGAAQAPAEGAQ
ncbi:MAG: ABC transporter ATP-binding protein, partial [Anaerolineales bacterium]